MKKDNLPIILCAIIFILSIVLAVATATHVTEFYICVENMGGSFEINFADDAADPMSVCIACGPDSYVDMPIPEKDGYTFEGWYYDEALTKKFEHTSTLDITPIEEFDEYGCRVGYKTQTFYAKWVK